MNQDPHILTTIHESIGHVIRVADELGILNDYMMPRGKNIWDIMHEIEKRMKLVIDTDKEAEQDGQIPSNL